MRSIKVTSTTSSWIKPVLELISLLDSNSVFAKDAGPYARVGPLQI